MARPRWTDPMDRLQLGLRRRVPQIIQSEAAECGLAALAMICGYHGLHLDLPYLRQHYGLPAQGAHLGQLAQIAHALQLDSRALALELDELKALRCPCILHWDFNHFVVLVGLKGRRLLIHDPAMGRRVIGLEEASRHFTGVALELWPAVQFRPGTHRQRLRLWPLMRQVRGLRPALLKILCLSLVIEAINLLTPVGTQLVMDHVIIARDIGLLTTICLGLLFFTLFRSFVAMIRTWISIVLGAVVDMQWKAGLFEHLLHLPLAYFEKRKLGDIQSRFGSLNTVRSTLSTQVISGIIDTVMSLGLIVMMVLYGGWLSWIVLAFTAVYAALRLATYRPYRQASEEQIIKEARAGSHFMETLYGIATLKALGLTESRSRLWLNLNVDAINARIHITRLDMLFGGINTFVNAIDQIAILWLGARQVIDNHMTLGMFVAFNAYRGQFSDRAANLVSLAMQLRMLSLHGERLSDIALTDPEPEAPPCQLLRGEDKASLEVRGVSFQYDLATPPVIYRLNLKVQAGESVALTGPSGLGKTTLMKLMCGLLVPTEGRIFINQLDIHKAGINNYRQQIACVLQDDKLFAGSISDNIACFNEDIDREWVVDCARRCHIDAEIMQLPMGYETLISELGGSLSGGQRQRLLLARALYRRPKILFLDEATSHLDLSSEARINQAIAELDITRIIVAHRPSTIASADRVVALDAIATRDHT
ncbi:peptidase domain-containing ABC transporter [Frateuria aurantia]